MRTIWLPHRPFIERRSESWEEGAEGGHSGSSVGLRNLTEGGETSGGQVRPSVLWAMVGSQVYPK